MTINARNGQNTGDLAIQTYGTIDSIVQMLNDNNLAFDDSFNNTPIMFNEIDNVDTNIYNSTTALGYFYSTGDYTQEVGGNGDFNSDFSSDFNNE